jgi:hypothetical protein
MNLRILFTLACLIPIALLPAVHAAGKKDTPARASFHMETDPTDNPKMVFQQAAGGRMRTFTRVPEISTNDIFSFAPFPADDGSYGILFALKDHAAKRLAAVTNMGQGRYLLSQLNGRVVDGVLIDKPVEDGKLVIWKGATLADIAILDESYPRIGQEGQKKKKKK